MKLTITALAAGGDGVARDDFGRVTFVPRTAPGDVVEVRIAKATKSYARAELVRVVTPGARVEPACAYFARGCGGCAWQHVAYPQQLAAKQAIVEGALRRTGATVHPIAHPAPPLGWRRRARFHVVDGRVGLYRWASHELIEIAHCPQLDPRLTIPRHAMDGELAIALGHDGAVAIDDEHVALEPDLIIRARDFAQASADANAALIACARAALGPGPGTLIELHAGAGNFTRGFRADDWTVTPSDAVPPLHPPDGFIVATAEDMLARVERCDAVVLDPPRAGAAEAIDHLQRLAPRTIVYISCDAATLARDVERLTKYRATDAWPFDAMPQTAHIETVLRLALRE